MRYPVRIQAMVKGGSPDLSQYQLEKLQKFYDANEGKYVDINVRQMGKPRSLPQNAYYWGVIVQMIADETGLDPEEVHEALKQQCGIRKVVELAGEKYDISVSTTKLSTDEFELYAERCRAFAAQFLQLVIPLPHESI